MINELNNRLFAFYSRLVPQLRDIIASNNKLSNPHFLFVPKDYFETRVRIMIVGQQTNGWGDKGILQRPDATEALMKLYAEFNLGEKYTRSPFWQAALLLHRLINPNAPARSFLWSNLVKVDQEGKRPIQEIEEQMSQLRLLQQEILITQPHAVVFFTGPYYDDRLVSCFPELSWDTPAMLLCLSHPNAEVIYLRSYHPNYLRLAKHWNLIETIADEVKSRTHGG